jgi:putative PIN family toxin of toxin-antitoxin system
MIDPPLLVLDTNVVLDWLVFRDPRVVMLWQWFNSQRARWLATPAMHLEFMQVLARPGMQAWAPDAEAVSRAWAVHAHMVPAALAAPWRCRDLSDQMFLDLAVAHQAQALLTRDRSLLALARRARAGGLLIGTPERWTGDRLKARDAAAR